MASAEVSTALLSALPPPVVSFHMCDQGPLMPPKASLMAVSGMKALTQAQVSAKRLVVPCAHDAMSVMNAKTHEGKNRQNSPGEKHRLPSDQHAESFETRLDGAGTKKRNLAARRLETRANHEYQSIYTTQT